MASLAGGPRASLRDAVFDHHLPNRLAGSRASFHRWVDAIDRVLGVSVPSLALVEPVTFGAGEPLAQRLHLGSHRVEAGLEGCERGADGVRVEEVHDLLRSVVL